MDGSSMQRNEDCFWGTEHRQHNYMAWRRPKLSTPSTLAVFAGSGETMDDWSQCGSCLECGHEECYSWEAKGISVWPFRWPVSQSAHSATVFQSNTASSIHIYVSCQFLRLTIFASRQKMTHKLNLVSHFWSAHPYPVLGLFIKPVTTCGWETMLCISV
jgi:hypothetical protein